MRAELNPLVDKVWAYCDSTGVRGRTVTLKVKFADFQIITRSRIARGADFGALDAGINQRGVAGGSVSDAERSSSYRRVALFAVRRCSRRRYANGSGVVSQLGRAKRSAAVCHATRWGENPLKSRFSQTVSFSKCLIGLARHGR